MTQEFLTIAQAEGMFGFNPRTTKEWIRKGLLKAYRPPGTRLLFLRVSDCRALLSSSPVDVPKASLIKGEL